MEIKHYFEFDGISSKDFNIKIKKDNFLDLPERHFEELEIEGRNGSLFIDYGTYKNRIIDIECHIDLRNEDDIFTIASQMTKWLKKDCKYKKLISSQNEDYYYEAVCINKISFEEILKNYNSFILSFSAIPFRKANNRKYTVKPSGGVEVYNRGEICEPIIDVYAGEGDKDIKIIINERIHAFKSVSGHFVINSELMDVYKITDLENINYNTKMQSYDFPYLDEGKNTIVVENVEKIEINPNFLYL